MLDKTIIHGIRLSHNIKIVQILFGVRLLISKYRQAYQKIQSRIFNLASGTQEISRGCIYPETPGLTPLYNVRIVRGAKIF